MWLGVFQLCKQHSFDGDIRMCCMCLNKKRNNQNGEIYNSFENTSAGFFKFNSSNDDSSFHA